jgi:hypothetical protein
MAAKVTGMVPNTKKTTKKAMVISRNCVRQKLFFSGFKRTKLIIKSSCSAVIENRAELFVYFFFMADGKWVRRIIF